MLSSIVTVIFAVGLITVGNGSQEEERSGYEAVVKCIQAGWSALGSDLRAKEGHAAKDSEKIEEACIFLRVRILRITTAITLAIVLMH